MAGIVGNAPIFWATGLVSALLELALPALFAATMLGPLLGKNDDARRAASTRKFAIARAVVGAAAILVAIVNVAVVAGVAAPG